MKNPANPDDPAEETEPSRGSDWMGRRLVDEVHALDQAVYNAVAKTPTPRLDVPITWISNAANYGRLWIIIAAAIAVAGGRGRRAAGQWAGDRTFVGGAHLVIHQVACLGPDDGKPIPPGKRTPPAAPVLKRNPQVVPNGLRTLVQLPTALRDAGRLPPTSFADR